MPFKPGRSGNPSGMSASRQRLTHAFHRDVFRAWKEHGPRCLDELARNDPGGFCRLTASLLPKQIHAEVNKIEFKSTMSLPDVLSELEALSERLGYELKPRQLPHDLKTLEAQVTRLPAKSNGEG